MIDRGHDLSITKQAEVLMPRPVLSADLAIMRHLDRLHLEFPFAGSRMLRGLLALQGGKIGRRHVKTLMRRMGIEALYRRPRTTKPEPGPEIFILSKQHPHLARRERDNIRIAQTRCSFRYVDHVVSVSAQKRDQARRDTFVSEPAHIQP